MASWVNTTLARFNNVAISCMLSARSVPCSCCSYEVSVVLESQSWALFRGTTVPRGAAGAAF
eukprot:5291294-Amphidinium_carterae.1